MKGISNLKPLHAALKPHLIDYLSAHPFDPNLTLNPKNLKPILQTLRGQAKALVKDAPYLLDGYPDPQLSSKC